MSIFLASFLKPFVLVIGLAGLLAVRLAIQRWMKDGKLKRLLLSDVSYHEPPKSQ
jgi:hypothetical protein